MAMPRKEEGIFTMDDIKAVATLQGFQMINHMSFLHLVIEGDSLVIVDALYSTQE